jgi:uncharacterized protein YigA (DUF484 family)
MSLPKRDASPFEELTYPSEQLDLLPDKERCAISLAQSHLRRLTERNAALEERCANLQKISEAYENDRKEFREKHGKLLEDEYRLGEKQRSNDRMRTYLEKRDAQLNQDVAQLDLNCKQLNKEVVRRVKEAQKERNQDKLRFSAQRVQEALAKQRVGFDLEVERRVEARLTSERLMAERKLHDQEVQTSVNVVVDYELAIREDERVKQVSERARLFDGVDEPARSDHTRCCVCLVNEVRVLYEPCMHVISCMDCAPRTILMCDKVACPTCNEPIKDLKRVYIGH